MPARRPARTTRAAPEPPAAASRVHWIASRELRISARGIYLLEFPAGCPVRLLWCEFDRGHRVTPNCHEFLELMQVMEGRGRFVIAERSYSIAPGDVLVVGAGEFHRIEADAGGRVRVAALHFRPEFIDSPGGPSLDRAYLRAFQFRAPGFAHRIGRAEIDERLVHDRIVRIESVVAAGGPLGPLAVRTYLADILLEIARARPPLPLEIPLGRRTRDLARLAPVFDLVREHYAERRPLREIARLAAMSTTHFCRVFRDVSGCTFGEFLLRTRVDAAATMITDSTRPVAEIAHATGFSSQSHFNRVFKRMKGTSPLHYRLTTPASPGRGACVARAG